MKKIAVMLASLLLMACSSGGHDELRAWMVDATKDIKGGISPYDAGNLVDPFKASKFEAQQKDSGAGMRPDLNRQREPLEFYPLESLGYVGVLFKNKVGSAIILANGALYQVRVGNYIGQDFGVVRKITDTELVLRELVQDSAGDWVERTSTLQLQDKEVKK